MNQGKYVFSQLVGFLPQRVFDRCVAKYNGNKRIRHFTCWNQLLCMMFGQLSGRESLRDLLISIQAHKSKYYHLGLGKNVSRSNLANANEKRDYRIYQDFAYVLIAEARAGCLPESGFNIETEGAVYAFDASVIDLCLSVFWWAKFRKTKAAIKLHTLYDVKTSIPAFVQITNAATHDVHGMDFLVYEAGGVYIFDRGYVDFERLFIIAQCEAYFLIRAKDNFQFRRIYSNKVDKSTGIRCDQIVKATGVKTAKLYPENLRRIKFYDAEEKRTFVFLTNNFKLTAEQIARLYKYRWKVELFFKWIKQHLKIKSFWGTSHNAVKTQVYIALITYTLVALIRSKLKIERSNYEILQILSLSLLDKTPVNQLLTFQEYQNANEHNCKQLKISLF